jgi:hypothetical protein
LPPTAGHGALEVLLVVLGETIDLGPERRQRIAARPWLEAAQPLPDVGEEPGLGLLAVGDDVQPGRTLPRHDVRDGPAFGLGEFRWIDRMPLRGRLHQVKQGRWPGQAADVRGADAIGAVLHDRFLPVPA